MLALGEELKQVRARTSGDLVQLLPFHLLCKACSTSPPCSVSLFSLFMLFVFTTVFNCDPCSEPSILQVNSGQMQALSIG